VPHVEQELFTLHEHLSSTPVLSGVRVTWHLVFCVMFLRSLFDLFPLANVFSVLWITASDYPFNSFNIALYVKMHKINFLKMQTSLNTTSVWITKQVMQTRGAQTLVSFKKCMPPSSSLLQGKHLLFFSAYLWSFRWPNYIVTLPRYFSFRLPHLNINTGPPSDELDKNIQRT
jgi:hypothetical protein